MYILKLATEEEHKARKKSEKELKVWREKCKDHRCELCGKVYDYQLPKCDGCDGFKCQNCRASHRGIYCIECDHALQQLRQERINKKTQSS